MLYADQKWLSQKRGNLSGKNRKIKNKKLKFWKKVKKCHFLKKSQKPPELAVQKYLAIFSGFGEIHFCEIYEI